jgi:hypothetical protein
MKISVLLLIFVMSLRRYIALPIALHRDEEDFKIDICK